MKKSDPVVCDRCQKIVAYKAKREGEPSAPIVWAHPVPKTPSIWAHPVPKTPSTDYLCAACYDEVEENEKKTEEAES